MVVLSLRQHIENQIHAVTGLDRSPVDYGAPEGDPGLFGPQSAVWVVHADFTAMLIGGISALCLQMLHPRVLAGVWDHSGFRRDMQGRLGRTAQFISIVSFAGRTQAWDIIARVRRIHDQVHGHLPDGTPYSANDPELLRWVHHTQAFCFLRACLRYKDPGLSQELRDAYVAEYARIGQALGADWLMQDARRLERLFVAPDPQLRVDERTREVATILMSSHAVFRGPKAWVGKLFLLSGLDMLPTWAQEYFDHRPAAWTVALRRRLVGGLAFFLRWATRNGSVHRARRRVACRRQGTQQ